MRGIFLVGWSGIFEGWLFVFSRAGLELRLDDEDAGIGRTICEL